MFFLGMIVDFRGLPSGKHTKNYGKSQCLMGKSTISMVIFNSCVTNYQRVNGCEITCHRIPG